MPVGEAFLSAFVQGLFDRLDSEPVLVYKRLGAKRILTIETELKSLKMALKNVEKFLNDAEEKQLKNKEVKAWLEELTDAAYDVEDLLDEVTTAASTNQDLDNKLFSSHKKSIQDIATRIDKLANERSSLGLEEVAARSTGMVRETSSVVDESGVWGRDDDKMKIIQLLLEDEPNVSVISIIGMVGVGKTTLAQIVYNDNEVKQHFNVRAWAWVSEEFDVKRITKSILMSLTSEASDSHDLNYVQVKLKEELRGKRFLIVLDDVWSKKYGDWDLLQNPFRIGKPGSKIIVTTRNQDVASMMGATNSHYLRHLSYNDCWLVFDHHAFGNGNRDPNLEEIGRRIVEKCQGLPLAAKTLGGLLCSKRKKNEWEEILNTSVWELPEKETDNFTALKLSYQNLPSHLKRCFAYCSILPKGHDFEEMDLVLLWMAEGLVQQPNGRKQMEDLGVEYFRDLVSRSFFQPLSGNKSKFEMHDLINDLAQWVAGKTSFRLEDKTDGTKQDKMLEKTRYSSSRCEDFEAFDKLTSLRTFLLMEPRNSPSSDSVFPSSLANLKRLRVLSLSRYRIKELPRYIFGMQHLRYLDLSDTLIQSFPDSPTTTPYHLQTLILKNCCKLEKLPAAMGNMINLYLLDITNANAIKEMPLHIGKLTSLKNLSNFIVGRDGGSGSKISELGKLKNLQGKLCISSLENVTAAGDAELIEKQELDVLELKWSDNSDASQGRRDEENLLSWLKPHTMLKELTICGYGGIKFPEWMGDSVFSGMEVLRLESCAKCTNLPPLGKLSSLKELRIKGMNRVRSVGIEFYGNRFPQPFPSLKTLCFEDMKVWNEWQVCFAPVLCELSIKICPNLLAIPPAVNLPSLEKIIIRECPLLLQSDTISNLPQTCQRDIQ